MRSLGILAATLAGALMSVCVKYTAGHYSPWEIVLYNSMGSVLLSLLFLKVRRLTFRPVCPFHQFARAALGVVSMALAYWCLQRLPLATTVTFRYSAPIYTVFFAILICLKRRQKPPFLSSLSVLAGFGGVLMILRPSFGTDIGSDMVLSAVAGPVIATIAVLLHRMGELGENPLRMLFYSSLACLCFGIVMTSATGMSPHSLDSLLPLTGICFFGLLNQLFVTLGWSRGNLVLGASMQLCGVVFATVLGICLFNEKPNGMSMTGICMVMAALLTTALLQTKNK